MCSPDIREPGGEPLDAAGPRAGRDNPVPRARSLRAERPRSCDEPLALEFTMNARRMTAPRRPGSAREIGFLGISQAYRSDFPVRYCYIIVTAGRGGPRGLGSPLTGSSPRSGWVLGSPSLTVPAKEVHSPGIGNSGAGLLDDAGPRAGGDTSARGPSHSLSLPVAPRRSLELTRAGDRPRAPTEDADPAQPHSVSLQTEARSTRRISMTTVSGGAPSIMASTSSAARAPSSRSGW